jgi:predicted dehydrogenase
MNTKNVLVLGSGFMAREYLRVLAAMSCKVVVVGRGEANIAALKADFPQFQYHTGGLEAYFATKPTLPEYAINSVSVEHLKATTIQLLAAGIAHILVEKPGDLYASGLEAMQKAATAAQANVWIAYNRRFYAAVQTLAREAAADGGIQGVHFEFTEWVHTIPMDKFKTAVLERWILANSSHVIDTVFALIGTPKNLNAIVHGQDEIAWHPSGSLFLGSGLSTQNIPFTYHSNWQSAGRWAIEVLTAKRRFYLKPMEKLQVQQKGSVAITEFEINDQLDTDFKPGIYLQTQAFLENNQQYLLSLSEQITTMPIYCEMSGYND